jgi:polyketide cyclase/dehydrase/lipid transport protein
MASIRVETVVRVQVDRAWDAVRDAGAAHVRLFPGILTDARLDGDARVVTFADGMVLRELIVDVDDDSRRFVYASVGGRAAHHNASIQVLAEGLETSRLVWITDVLPHELAAPVGALMRRGSEVMRATLEATHGDIDSARAFPAAPA